VIEILSTNAILIYLSCLIVIYLIGKIFYVPLKLIGKIALNSILGGILITIINLIGSAFSFHIGLNIWTALTVGVLGIPGAILLIIIKIFL